MECREAVQNRIVELEKKLEKVNAKIAPGNKALKYAIEAENLRYAITELYICLGQSSSGNK